VGDEANRSDGPKPRKPRAGAIHVLSTRSVRTQGPGSRSDGGGLVLVVRRDGSASWIFRYTASSGARREMGLGACHRGSDAQAGESLAAARQVAARARAELQAGTDPIDARASRNEAAAQAKAQRKEAASARRERGAWTLARCAREYHARVIEPNRTPRHAAQWISSLENHVPADLWHAPIGSITAPQLLRALAGVRLHERARNVTGDGPPLETIRRIRQRLESVFADALFHERCSSNPAAIIKRKVAEEVLVDRAKGGEGFRALHFTEAPVFMAELRQQEGTAARALEFLTLCASRTGEVLGAQWSEVDRDAGLWRIPAARMKARKPHTVYLSDAARNLLQQQRGLSARWVFPSPMNAARALSNAALLAVLDRMKWRDRTTVHGLRKAFSSWANETCAGRHDVIELTLAHRDEDAVRQTYNRAQYATERRALLAKWAAYLGQPAAEVLPLRQGAAA